MRNLTPTERRALDAIRAHIRSKGYPPTLKEIGRASGIASTSHVSRVRDQLVQKGYLRHTIDAKRGIALVDDGALAPTAEVVEVIKSCAFVALASMDRGIAVQMLPGDDPNTSRRRIYRMLDWLKAKGEPTE